MYIAKNPVRSFNEVKNISKSHIEEMLLALREKGVRIIVMSGVDDPLFPMEMMQKIVKRGMIDGFVSVRGGHGEIGNNPGYFMAAAENMLTQAESNSQAKKVE